jgi:hypothetical protein
MGGISGAARRISGDFFDIGGAIADELERALEDLLIPDIPEPEQVSGESQSASLTNRRNRAVVGGRWPEIFGQVVSVPNVIMRPYRKYQDNVKFEVGYYIVGRDQIDVDKVREGGTLLSTTAGSSAEIYHPDNSPLSGSPVKTIGSAITDPIYTVFTAPELKAQSLRAPNEFEVVTLANNVTVTSAGVITEISTEDAAFNQSLKVGQSVVITGMTAASINLDGTYVITAVGGETMSITPTGNWLTLPTGDQTVTTEATLKPSDTQEAAFTDWVEFTKNKIDRIWGNLNAPGGLYKSADNVDALTVNLRMEVQLLDDNGDPLGLVQTVNDSLTGRSRNSQGLSLEYVFGGPSFCRVRFARTNNFDFDFDGQTQDDISLVEIFAAQDLEAQHFGNCTTILTRRESDAIGGGANELTCVATEMLNVYSGGSFAGTKTLNTDPMQSLIRFALDPVGGNMPESELDLDQISGVSTEINNYFTASINAIGLVVANLRERPEETINKICDAVHCFPYRGANGKIQVYFEKSDQTPRRMFTHRSKTGEETWSRSLNANNQEFDGVEINYLDLDTQSVETYQLPEDGSAVKPKRLKTSGLVGIDAAKIRANRELNKIKYARVLCECAVFNEGRLLRRGEPVAIVKGSRIKTYDGYVVAVDGLVLTLSNDVEFTDGEDHSIRLKNETGGIETIDCFEGSNSREVILNAAPTMTIYTGYDQERTEFVFGSESRQSSQVMIVQKAIPSENNVKLTAFNYDARYYAEDEMPPSGSFSDAFSEDFN